MATLAIGDIHGNLAALRSLLDRIRPHVGPDDTVVFLGDYIDRGPDSRGCIEEILRLREEDQFRVVTLRGNHEDWLLATMDDYAKHSWLLGADAFATVESYSPMAAEVLRSAVDEAGSRLVLDDFELPYGAFFEAMPASHRVFFRDLPAFHEADGTVFVHAGLDPDGGPPGDQSPRELTWGLAHGFARRYFGPHGVVYGHRNDCELDRDGWPRPRVTNALAYGIDSISTGVLTALRMPDGAVFQSERFR